MTEAEQEINVRRPRPDAVQGGERGVRLVGRTIGERGKVDLAAIDRLGDRLERADFGRGKSGARELRRTRAQHGGVVERIEREVEPFPDGARARGRKLLRHHDLREPGKAIGAAAQRRLARDRQRLPEARIGRDEAAERRVEIGLGVDVEGHGGRDASPNPVRTQPISRT